MHNGISPQTKDIPFLILLCLYEYEWAVDALIAAGVTPDLGRLNATQTSKAIKDRLGIYRKANNKVQVKLVALEQNDNECDSSLALGRLTFMSCSAYL